jgi:hypothetical protein
LHGALYALVHGRATVAIDQVEGDAKISAILGRIGWPLVFRPNQTNPAEIEQAFEFARSPDILPIVERCRIDAIARSVNAVERASVLISGKTHSKVLAAFIKRKRPVRLRRTTE